VAAIACLWQWLQIYGSGGSKFFFATVLETYLQDSALPPQRLRFTGVLTVSPVQKDFIV